MLTRLAVALTAVPAPQLATIPFRTVELSAARGERLAEYLATRLVEAGVRVTTPRDLDAVLGLDRPRPLPTTV